MSEKVTNILEEIKTLSVMEVVELVNGICETFGVSATAAVATTSAADAAAPAADEKSEYEVMLTSAGEAKMNVIKAIKDILGLGLKESKTLVDSAPCSVKKGISGDEAEEIKKKLEEAGASVELK